MMNNATNRCAGSRQPKQRQISLAVAAALLSLTLAAGETYALPTGEQVTAGTATVQRAGASLTVNQATPNVAINWQSFGIAASEVVRFNQPGTSSIALNRVLGQDSSQILGTLSANGQIFILNPNGVLFGNGAQVSVGGLVASTLNMSDQDFMAGRHVLTRGMMAGTVVNQAAIVTTEGGYVALIAPQVSNLGSINAPSGTVALAAGDRVTLTLNNGSLFGVTVEQGTLNALVENKNAIRANGGQVILTAKAMDQIARSVVNNSGIIEAGTLSSRNGVIRLEGDDVRNSGTIAASQVSLRAVNTIALESGSRISADAENAGGTIEFSAGFVALGGTVSADGATGGTIRATALGTLSLAENVSARGRSGSGGRIEYASGGATIEPNSSVNDASGATDGGSIMVNAAGGLLSSGTYRARGETGAGGRVDLTGGAVRLLSAQVDASGATQGGLVRIGGAYQGGRLDEQDARHRTLFLDRYSDAPEIASSDRTFVNNGVNVDVSGRGISAQGGTAIVWSKIETTFLGAINATGVLQGGAIELSSKEILRRADLSHVDAGPGGLLLLDPRNIVVGDAATVSNWSLQAILGSGYSVTGSQNVPVVLGSGDTLGIAVALNAAGDRLAVGANGDDGATNLVGSAGAVHLFTFTDTNFSGGALAATLGSGYTGGKNVNVALDSSDNFGVSVALNAAGDRLAAGAYLDRGVTNTLTNAGAVRLFTFADTRFSGGALAGTVGSGYTGGGNVNVALDSNDLFGISVALNAAGDRLAVGAQGDGGAGNAKPISGAVRLFTFADRGFSGGALAATLGFGYTGGNNVNVALDANDRFGRAVALNAAGDRLAVGANLDGGAAHAGFNLGAVHLFTFADSSFTGGARAAILGSGYTGGKNVNVALDSGDVFGSAVALNAAGDRLAVGALGDDGAANAKGDSGAVHLFTFTDTSFSGGTLAATLGSGYTGGKNVNVPLDANDAFGSGVALSAVGDRLAASSQNDAGAGNANAGSGAVHLFTFTDTNFSMGTLAATIGSGYTGGKNVNVALDPVDNFGTSVALNGAGDRLAVGDYGDAGLANASPYSGAVRLFTFTDTNFSGGALAATVGSGYTGGKNVDVALDAYDLFGASVALNAAGNRLAVGAFFDSGAGNANAYSGAVRLFTFTDTSFSGGALAATIGSGYTGGKSIDVALDPGDGFGISVALNSAGDRLAVGAFQDDGATNVNANAGAVRLFTFTDTSFSGGALAATLGSGYTGGKNVNVALDPNDNFGIGVALNAAGDRLAVGAYQDAGAGNANPNAGAVHLFSFTDRSFSGGTLAATLGSGYTGGKNVNVSLDSGDGFGEAVALNAAGDRLAVGVYQDAGATNANSNAGAVRLFTFTDTNFSGGTLSATIGSGYTGGRNVNVPLDSGDNFGISVALNAAGDRLAVGAYQDSGAANANPNAGAVYLFSAVPETGPYPAQNQAFTDFANQSITVGRADLERLLALGTAVTLQASNDITVSSAVNVNNPAGNGGALTLQAGRSVLLNQSVMTDNGSLTLIGNDRLASGVVDALRDAGAAVIVMAAGTRIDTGTGAVTIELRDGAGKTNVASGAITLGSIAGGAISAVNSGPNAGDIIIDSGATLSASGTGNALALVAVSGGNVINNAGAGALSAANGRWLVYSNSPAGTTENGLTAAAGSTLPRLYNRTYAANSPATVTEPGSHLIYSAQPTLTVTAVDMNRTYGDANPAFTYSPGGYVVDDGVSDNAATAGLTGSATLTTNAVGTSGVASYPISAATGNLASGAGYGFSFVGGMLTVVQRGITATADDKTRFYGDANPALTQRITSGNLVNGDALAGTASTVATISSNVGGYTIGQGTATAGANYRLTFVDGRLNITQRPIVVTADDKTRFYGDANPALTQRMTAGNLVNGDTLAGMPGTVATISSNVGGYAIGQGTVTAGPNYQLGFVGGSLTIAQRPIVVTAHDTTRLYGDANPAFTQDVTSGNLVNDDTLAGAARTVATTTSNVGDYAIGQGTVTAGSNYLLTFVDGNLVITPRPLSVMALDTTRTYGDANPLFTYLITTGTLLSSDALVGSLASPATAGSDVGHYTIMQGTLGNPNYALAFTNGRLTVNQRVITVTANDQTKIYGDPDMNFTFYTSSLGAGAPLAGFLERIAGEEAGLYDINQFTPTSAGSANYLMSFVSSTLDIAEAPPPLEPIEPKARSDAPADAARAWATIGEPCDPATDAPDGDLAGSGDCVRAAAASKLFRIVDGGMRLPQGVRATPRPVDRSPGPEEPRSVR